MSTTRMTAQLFLVAALFVVLTPTAQAQEIDHRRATMPKQTHGLVHLDRMRKMLQQMDTTLQQSHQLEQQIAERMQQMPAGAATQHQGVMPRMNDRMIVLTDHLNGLATDMRTMMTDEAMLGDRAMQTDMEQIQQQLGAMATETEKTLKALDRMVKRMSAAARKP